MSTPSLAVIGGTGFAGTATVQALVGAGHRVRVISRRPPTASPTIEPVAADAASPDSLATALSGVQTAVLCARPEYWNWPTELVPMIEAVLSACERSGTRLVMCDNLYAYGVPDGPMTESSPVRPHGPKGRARKEAAEVLMRAHDLGRVEVAIGRAADFYGPGVRYPNLEQLFSAALAGKTVRVMGAGAVPHSISFIHDVGRGLAALATDDRAFGNVWHLPVAPPMTETAFAERLCELAGTGARVGHVPGWAVHAVFSTAGLFSPLMRELKEVLYQHELPFVVDDSRFVKTFGLSATPLDEALGATLSYWRSTLGPARAAA